MRRVMDVNFFSAVEVLKALATKKINGKNLRNVILISSIAATNPSKGGAFYSASKAAVNIFVRVMADELAPNTRVNTIAPGMIHTSMTENYFNNKTWLEKYNHRQLLGFCEPQDIANMAEFLMSDKSCRITGQHFIVDGGDAVAL